jgi:hypothetical protein
MARTNIRAVFMWSTHTEGDDLGNRNVAHRVIRNIHRDFEGAFDRGLIAFGPGCLVCFSMHRQLSCRRSTPPTDRSPNSLRGLDIKRPGLYEFPDIWLPFLLKPAGHTNALVTLKVLDAARRVGHDAPERSSTGGGCRLQCHHISTISKPLC